MLVLALDTSAQACSVAISDAARNCVGRFEMLERGHAERVSSMIAEVASELGPVSDVLKSVGRIAVTTGPGSFTGVRVGISAARGLALGRSTEFVGLTTDALLAAQTGGGGPCAVAMDARRGEIYASLYNADGAPLIRPHVTTVPEFAAHVPAGAVLLGSAAESLATLAQTPLSVDAAIQPDARILADIARSLPADLRAPAPLYLRRPDAKPQTDKVLRRQTA